MPAIQPAAQPIKALTELALNALRQRGGVASGAELQADLRVSQPTVSRALAPLLHTGRVRKVGAARSLRCSVPRAVPSAGVQVPVVCIDAQVGLQLGARRHTAALAQGVQGEFGQRFDGLCGGLNGGHIESLYE